MKQRAKFFLVVMLLMFNISVSSQIKSPLKPFISTSLPIGAGSGLLKYKPVNPGIQEIKTLNLNSLRNYPKSIFLSNFNAVDHLGFFCKKEIALDKITPVAFRFRLGSIDYVNYLEQKPNALKPR